MKIRNLLLGTLLSALPIMGLFCVGGTSESGNAHSVVMGSIVDDKGSVHGAQVQLVAEGYIPGNDTAGKVFTTHTDDQGAYRFEVIPKGDYYLNSRFLGKRLLRGPIGIAKPEEDLAIDTLYATIKITMRLSDTSSINVIFLKGTAESRAVASKTTVLDSMPSGDVTIVGFTQHGEVPQILTSANSLQLTVFVAPADTANAAFNNAPPRIITLPSELSRTSLKADSEYQVTIIADDPENDVIRFILKSAPSGMSLDSLSGKIIWQPNGSSAIGYYRIGVEVADVKGSSRSIWWTITVVESSTPGPDTVAPIITLLGKDSVTISITDKWIEPGYTAWDDKDSNITGKVTISSSVNVSQAGIYVINYNVSDAAGNAAITKSRKVYVIPNPIGPDTMRPEIMLLGKSRDTVHIGEVWTDPGYTVWDNRDSTGLGVAVKVTIKNASGTVVPQITTETQTTFTLSYVATDTAGNQSDPKQRIVVVTQSGTKDDIKPMINLEGASKCTVDVGTSFIDPGATAVDSVPGNPRINLSASITRVVKDSMGAVVPFDLFYKSIGLYTIIYSVSDEAGNSASATRFVFVRDTVSPN